MKKIFYTFIFLFVSMKSMASSPSHDPYLLANEIKSEYTIYLKSIFERAKTIPTKMGSIRPNLKKGTPGYKFRSEIKRQVKMNQVNFAGEWSLVVIGCGMHCNKYFLIQSKTGKVIDSYLMTTNGNPLFVNNKNILVTQGSVEQQNLAEAQKGVLGGPKAWQWNGKTFKEISL